MTSAYQVAVPISEDENNSDSESHVTFNDRGKLNGGGCDETMICCTAVFIILGKFYFFSLFVFGIVAVIIDYGSLTDSELSIHVKMIWIISVANIVVYLLSFLAIASQKKEESTSLSRCLNSLSSILLFTVWIWGLVVYSKLDHDTMTFMNSEYHLLWIYFQMCIWTTTAILSLAFLFLLSYCCCQSKFI